MSAKVYTTPLQNLYEGTRPGGAVVVLYHDYTLLEDRIRALESQDEVHWKTRRTLLVERDALAAELAVAQQTNREWLAANAPGGWIDNLRKGLTAETACEWHISHSMRSSREGKTFSAVCDKCGWTDFDQYSKAYLLRECTVPKQETKVKCNACGSTEPDRNGYVKHKDSCPCFAHNQL